MSVVAFLVVLGLIALVRLGEVDKRRGGSGCYFIAAAAAAASAAIALLCVYGG